ncbi:LIM zinc-binding domain-containing protein [Meloidogyne graminicola]|uniref:LIM zinc-binding domain-containing protein n=1 Tax=Meloidogyne graminicola TaxID=189291 RepID=A0A8T0A3P8_9BILA|nr:LIM zinc-binding domain-containing protein [Meloidogyne graminicola]
MFLPPTKKTYCSICNNEVDTFDQKVALERHIVHKECFRCGICDVQLNQGSCSFDHILYRHYEYYFNNILKFNPIIFKPATKRLINKQIDTSISNNMKIEYNIARKF